MSAVALQPLDRMSREDLIEELAWRRSEMGEGIRAHEIDALRGTFGLTPQESHAVLILYRAKERGVTRAALLEQLPSKHRSEDAIGDHVRVVVSHVRRKMGRTVIKTFGDGHGRYAMPPDARARVAAALCTIPDELRRTA